MLSCVCAGRGIADALAVDGQLTREPRRGATIDRNLAIADHSVRERSVDPTSEPDDAGAACGGAIAGYRWKHALRAVTVG